jgi:hypothetical protein
MSKEDEKTNALVREFLIFILLKIFSFEVVTKKQSGKLEKQCE